MKLRIGTRGSDLALWQARFVRATLDKEGCEVEIVVLKTRGDRIDDVPLQDIEGKAFFTAEIEAALHAGDVDLAVHSHKDLPVDSPEGLVIAAVPPRASHLERLLVARGAHAEEGCFLPLVRGARVGTSSPRREAQLRALRPDLEVLPLRGNVPTRVQRLRAGRYDAILLAAAGLERLELDTSGLVVRDLDQELCVPAPAQGALAIQTRVGDEELIELCRRALHAPDVARAVAAERSLLTRAGGGCNLALGATLTLQGSTWCARVFRGPDATDEQRVPRWAEARDADPERAAELALRSAAGDAATLRGPLADLNVTILGSKLDGTLIGRRLESLGAELRHVAVITHEDLDPAPLHAALRDLEPGDVLALTSAKAASYLSELTIPDGVVLAAVGKATQRVLESAGHQVAVVGSQGARDLASNLALQEGARVLHPCAEDALFELQAGLGERGTLVQRVPVYRTLPLTPASIEDSLATERTTEPSARIYMSPSSVAACLAWELARPGRPDVRIAYGMATGEALARAGLSAFVPPDGERESIVHHLHQLRAQEILR